MAQILLSTLLPRTLESPRFKAATLKERQEILAELAAHPDVVNDNQPADPDTLAPQGSEKFGAFGRGLLKSLAASTSVPVARALEHLTTAPGQPSYASQVGLGPEIIAQLDPKNNYEQGGKTLGDIAQFAALMESAPLRAVKGLPSMLPGTSTGVRAALARTAGTGLQAGTTQGALTELQTGDPTTAIDDAIRAGLFGAVTQGMAEVGKGTGKWLGRRVFPADKLNPEAIRAQEELVLPAVLNSTKSPAAMEADFKAARTTSGQNTEKFIEGNVTDLNIDDVAAAYKAARDKHVVRNGVVPPKDPTDIKFLLENRGNPRLDPGVEGHSRAAVSRGDQGFIDFLDSTGKLDPKTGKVVVDPSATFQHSRALRNEARPMMAGETKLTPEMRLAGDTGLGYMDVLKRTHPELVPVLEKNQQAILAHDIVKNAAEKTNLPGGASLRGDPLREITGAQVGVRNPAAIPLASTIANPLWIGRLLNKLGLTTESIAPYFYPATVNRK